MGACIRAVVFDVDGVLRHLDPEQPARIESEYNIAEGLLIRCALEKTLLRRVVCGEISHDAWVRCWTADLAARLEGCGTSEATELCPGLATELCRARAESAAQAFDAAKGTRRDDVRQRQSFDITSCEPWVNDAT